MTVDMKPLELTLQDRVEQIKKGGAAKYHEKNQEQGKMFVRDRLSLLFDPGFELEDALFANYMSGDL
ncbi:MAG: acyl-CoA carboxylase subunit beta, partial [Bacillota bacterium]|nr:acyl-CoA carboxylase subunit beta [Bacillota bacterium]